MYVFMLAELAVYYLFLLLKLATDIDKALVVL